MFRLDHDIELIPIGDLMPPLRNARTHSKKQIRKLANAIEAFEVIIPLVIDDGNMILAGSARFEAAKLLGLSHLPCIRMRNMSEAKRRAFALAENEIGRQAGYDYNVLALELYELEISELDVTLTGFDRPQIDIILADAAAAATGGADPTEDVPVEALSSSAVTRLGDAWTLGRHRLLCGDAKDPALVALLMGGRQANMIFTDPPYNVPIDGHVSGLGRIRHREFAEAAGEMNSEEFIAFLVATLGAAAAVCRDGAIAYVCMDWRHVREVLAAGSAVFSQMKNLCVWNKTNAGMGSFYRSQHELIFVWKIGVGPHTNTFGLGDGGRYRTNVWTYAGANAFKSERLEELKLHPTVKPLAMVADAIRDVTHRGEIVLDIFGGSGTTLIAAQKTGRCARLIEIDPRYCDAIIRRWEKLTGKSAVLDGDGRTFEEIADARGTWVSTSTGWAA